MSIAFIAPFERICIKAQSIIDTAHYPAKVYKGDLHQGVIAARQAMEEGAKIIISRGGTARMIRQQLDIDVIEVESSMLRTLAYIYKETTQTTRIGIAGFKQLINRIEPVCDILGRTYRSFELKGNTSFKQIMDTVAEWNPDIVIGDAVSFQWAESRGLNAYLIESSMETIVDAFERAMLVLKNLNRHISTEKKLAAVLDCTHDGTVLVSSDGRIEEINSQGCNILGHPKETLLGADFSTYFNGKELDSAVGKKQLARSIIINYRNEKLAVDHIAISSDELTDSSSVLLFQPVRKIQETGNAIRKKLTESGFYAKYTFSNIVFGCKKMQQVVTIARQYSRTAGNIMIEGETGTGKELFAQSIHNTGPLADGPFVALNCAALPGNLLESELFGYAPGAFTGALKSGKIGLFELAHKGTLFLDELTEMDIFLQSKLLRALQAREIMRIGDNKIIPIDVRIIATTNKKPLREIKKGRLRADLFYRLNVLDLYIPPLRERNGDIEMLFSHFLKERCRQQDVAGPKISSRMVKQLRRHSWPGNVRELENFTEKYAILHELPRLEIPLTALTPEIPATSNDNGTLEEIISAKVYEVYKRENLNISKTAQRLSIDRNTVKRWLDKGSAAKNRKI
jgi:transcriptional regulator with PAS, ATPase and Fis domain